MKKNYSLLIKSLLGISIFLTLVFFGTYQISRYGSFQGMANAMMTSHNNFIQFFASRFGWGSPNSSGLAFNLLNWGHASEGYVPPGALSNKPGLNTTAAKGTVPFALQGTNAINAGASGTGASAGNSAGINSPKSSGANTGSYSGNSSGSNSGNNINNNSDNNSNNPGNNLNNSSDNNPNNPGNNSDNNPDNNPGNPGNNINNSPNSSPDNPVNNPSNTDNNPSNPVNNPSTPVNNPGTPVNNPVNNPSNPDNNPGNPGNNQVYEGCVLGCYPGCIPGCDAQCTPPDCLLGNVNQANLPTINPLPSDPQVSQNIAQQNQENETLAAILASREALVVPVQQQAQASKYDTVSYANIPAPSTNPAPPDIEAKVQSRQYSFH